MLRWRPHLLSCRGTDFVRGKQQHNLPLLWSGADKKAEETNVIFIARAIHTPPRISLKGVVAAPTTKSAQKMDATITIPSLARQSAKDDDGPVALILAPAILPPP